MKKRKEQPTFGFAEPEPMPDHCIPKNVTVGISVPSDNQYASPFSAVAYDAYIKSKEWEIKRQFALNRANHKCEHCGKQGTLQVHHKHYRTLGRESPEDIEALCLECHGIADQKRQSETRHRVQSARLDGWATKKYGENWHWHMDEMSVHDEFEDWLENREE